MNRRTAIGVAATALMSGGCGQKAVNANKDGQKRKPIGHESNKDDNYRWRNKENQARAQMLAFTMLLFNGNKANQPHGFFLEFRDNGPEYRDKLIAAGNKTHPFVMVGSESKYKDMYVNVWKKCDHMGWGAAADKLRDAATIMMDFANAGLNKDGDTYNGPDECPCQGYYQDDPDCEVVTPLL